MEIHHLAFPLFFFFFIFRLGLNISRQVKKLKKVTKLLSL